jgi:hypothetical protein
MIPPEFVTEHGESAIKRRCRIKCVDQIERRISVEL